MIIACMPCSIGKSVLIDAAPAMPPQLWWLTALVAFILLLAATIDAFTMMVPDFLIFFGLVAITGIQGLFFSWQLAGLNFWHALEAGAAIWLLNLAWYAKFRSDALGMGDAKWTMLAASCFGILPVTFAWGIGAILASIFILIARLARYDVLRVTFAPFLLVGLTAGLYWLRFYFFVV